MHVTNTSDQPAAFRDDAGKHILEPWESIEVKGRQHLPAILAVPGIVEGIVNRPRRKAAEEEAGA